MKTRSMQTLAAMVLVTMTATVAWADSFTFDTTPSGGTIAGAAGDTIGWGYAIGNDSRFWLVAASVDASGFAFGTPDSSIFDFPILAPHTTVSQPYDPVNGLGLFQFTWDADAFARANVGTFTIHFDKWTGDPFNGGTIEDDQAIVDAPYLAFTTAAQTVATPEPASMLLLLTGLGLLRRRRR